MKREKNYIYFRARYNNQGAFIATDNATEEVAALRVENDQLREKALRFELDAAGIEQREKESVELVELRAENIKMTDEVEKIEENYQSMMRQAMDMLSENEQLKKWQREMVEKAAAKSLDGYRDRWHGSWKDLHNERQELCGILGVSIPLGEGTVIQEFDSRYPLLESAKMIVKERDEARAEVERLKEKIGECHDWYCGCGHWNGAGLSVCAMCGRTPAETSAALKVKP